MATPWVGAPGLAAGPVGSSRGVTSGSGRVLSRVALGSLAGGVDQAGLDGVEPRVPFWEEHALLWSHGARDAQRPPSDPGPKWSCFKRGS